MKKTFLFLAFVLVAGVAVCQNVIGKTIYYNDSTKYRPWHGYGYDDKSYSLKNTYSTFFLEGQFMTSRTDAACGATFAIVPERIGGYLTGTFNNYASWWSFGPVVRVTDYSLATDLQLYAGLVLSDVPSPYVNNVGGEVGIRIASSKDWALGNWSLCSFLAGLKFINNSVFFAFGASVPLSLVVSPFVIFF